MYQCELIRITDSPHYENRIGLLSTLKCPLPHSSYVRLFNSETEVMDLQGLNHQELIKQSNGVLILVSDDEYENLGVIVPTNKTIEGKKNGIKSNSKR